MTNDDAYNLGVERFQAGDLDGAIEAFTTAITQDPNDASAWFNRGVCYGDKAKSAGHFLAEGDAMTVVGGPGTRWYERAIDDYTQAIAIAERAPYLVNRAYARHMLGRRDLAIADAQRAAELGDAKALRLLREVFGAE